MIGVPNQNMMGITLGSQGLNNMSLVGAHPPNIHNLNGQMNNSHLYTGGNEIESDKVENVNEDMLMMNIPREGNADQLNKSTKLTLSSKKQFDTQIQPKTNQSNQYTI
jgi:hypothetical protein